VDSTNHKGVYEIQLADARFGVSNAKSLLVSVLGATNAAETDVVIPLRDLDPFDAVRAGLTALPNVASGSAGSLLTSGTGTSQLNVSGGTAAADMVEIAGQTVTAAAAVTFPATISSLTAAGVRSELAVELGRIDTTIGSRLASAGYTTPPTSAAIADAVLDDAVEGSETLRQAVRLIRAAAVGKLSGAATTEITIRDAADTKARITATVDSNGNRSAVTTDAT
jgi:hypothetical protein